MHYHYESLFENKKDTTLKERFEYFFAEIFSVLQRLNGQDHLVFAFCTDDIHALIESSTSAWYHTRIVYITYLYCHIRMPVMIEDLDDFKNLKPNESSILIFVHNKNQSNVADTHLFVFKDLFSDFT